MKHLKNLSLVLSLFISAACSTKTKMVATRMLTPEAQGKLWKGNADIRAQGITRQELNFKNDQTKNKLEVKSDSYEAGLSAEMGLWPKLDVYFQPSFMDSPTILGLKVQVWGDNRMKAKQGNISAAIFGGVGSHHANQSQTREERPDYISKLKVQHDREEIGLMAGYRITDPILVYLSGQIYNEKISGRVATRTGLLETEFRYFGTGSMYSVGGIYYLGKHYQFKLDYTQLAQDWSHTGSRSSGFVNGALGFFW